jgi:hypothetical protein
MTKLKWKVEPRDTGRASVFNKRGWPDASINGSPAFMIRCDGAYSLAYAKSGNHAELALWVAKYHDDRPGFTWKKLKKRSATLKDAKALADEFMKANPDFFSNMD